MTGDETRAQDLDLRRLLQGIGDGKVVLPNFQRDFDWTDADVRALLGTILSGWPIGSLLLIEGSHEFYSPRSIEDGPAPATEISYLVLDGQQRLTALYHAFYARGPLRYALRVDHRPDFADIDAVDDALRSVKAEVWARRFSNPKEQWAAGYLPMYALRSASEFFEWRDEALGAEEVEGRSWLTSAYREFLSGLHDYRVPAVIIPRDIPPIAVARIFERVNKSGMTLGAFDLMVAKSFTAGFNLRTLWEGARRERPLLKAFLQDDGLPILNVIALRQRAEIRQSAVLELPGSAIRDGWDDAVEHFDAALRAAVGHFGILDPSWLPYRPILVVLAALDYEFSVQIESDLLTKWYWATVLGRRYDVASNTRAVADFQSLARGEDPIERPPLLIREVLLEATRRQQGTLHRAFLTVLGSRVRRRTAETANFEDADGLTAESLYVRDPDGDLDPPLHLRSLSFVLSTGKSDQWAVVERDQQFLPPDFDDAEEFLEYRLERLAEFASEKVGARVRVLTQEQLDGGAR
ncbi:DUF262 domain-containing protein [Cellulomonas iranensis]|uniref:DUF262 domain-containing protein n=1 Tax=Cellulomonas iranensis TaxID=76862 RepID=UPI001CF2FC88|nr:DUF262 domain-containing protein [Cellulomonas iranensis]UCN14051.1 DUF262 domain-containing protein [Cellulomonas iranensis]